MVLACYPLNCYHGQLLVSLVKVWTHFLRCTKNIDGCLVHCETAEDRSVLKLFHALNVADHSVSRKEVRSIVLVKLA